MTSTGERIHAGRFARAQGPGYAPWPRHMVVRVNDLVAADVADTKTIKAELAVRGIPVSARTSAAGLDVQAVLSANAAGTVVTLERRTSVRHRRAAALRELTRTLEAVTSALVSAREIRRDGPDGPDGLDGRRFRGDRQARSNRT